MKKLRMSLMSSGTEAQIYERKPNVEKLSRSACRGHRWQFEDAWRKYCADYGTASQPSNIRALRAAVVAPSATE